MEPAEPEPSEPDFETEPLEPEPDNFETVRNRTEPELPVFEEFWEEFGPDCPAADTGDLSPTADLRTSSVAARSNSKRV